MIETENELRDKILKSQRFGIALPLTSLLTRDSFETGDFYTLEKMAPFMKEIGATILQLLPLNDVGFGRSPYSSISAFAIDPLYISLHNLGLDIKNRKAVIQTVEINIRRVRELKVKALLEYFQKNLNTELEIELKEFRKSQIWLDSYIAFKILYEKNQGESFLTWKESEYSKEVEKQILAAHEIESKFICFLQFTAYAQLRKVKNIFETANIFLKGDMPILTAKNSADVWAKKNLFLLDLQAGAPPDQFSDIGQNWAFPIFNWEEMKKENYAWWKDRLKYLENFFHIYRIDHVLGMYRIWAIPEKAESAKQGYFFPQIGTSRAEFLEVNLKPEDFVNRKIIYEFEKDKFIFYWDFYKYEGYYTLDEEIKKRLYPLSHKHLKEDEKFWKKAGEEILSLFLNSSNMLPCAEDLGAVPAFVRDSIIENKVIGLDIIRWTRSLDDGTFIKAKDYRKNAVSSFSVHDTSLALEWWEDFPDEEKKVFAELIGHDLTDTSKFNLMKQFIEFALSTNSLFSIQLFNDILFEERANSINCFMRLNLLVSVRS